MEKSAVARGGRQLDSLGDRASSITRKCAQTSWIDGVIFSLDRGMFTLEGKRKEACPIFLLGYPRVRFGSCCSQRMQQRRVGFYSVELRPRPSSPRTQGFRAHTPRSSTSLNDSNRGTSGLVGWPPHPASFHPNFFSACTKPFSLFDVFTCKRAAWFVRSRPKTNHTGEK